MGRILTGLECDDLIIIIIHIVGCVSVYSHIYAYRARMYLVWLPATTQLFI